jgi:hypothetical protein
MPFEPGAPALTLDKILTVAHLSARRINRDAEGARCVTGGDLEFGPLHTADSPAYSPPLRNRFEFKLKLRGLWAGVA